MLAIVKGVHLAVPGVWPAHAGLRRGIGSRAWRMAFDARHLVSASRHHHSQRGKRKCALALPRLFPLGNAARKSRGGFNTPGSHRSGGDQRLFQLTSTWRGCVKLAAQIGMEIPLRARRHSQAVGRNAKGCRVVHRCSRVWICEHLGLRKRSEPRRDVGVLLFLRSSTSVTSRQ